VIKRRVSKLVGEQLKVAREAAGLRQDEIAKEARRCGLAWTRATIAAIETGRRTVTVDELPELVTVLSLVRKRDDRLSFAPVPHGSDYTRSVELQLGAESWWFNLTTPAARAEQAGLARNERAIERWPGLERAELQAAHVHAVGEVERQAARRLHADALDVAIGAGRLWGRTLTEERDARVATGGGERATRTLRGHVTRDLFVELARSIGVPKNMPAKGQTRATSTPRQPRKAEKTRSLSRSLRRRRR
jgi:transcriptional regulator with XRE-family HTH domain